MLSLSYLSNFLTYHSAVFQILYNGACGRNGTYESSLSLPAGECHLTYRLHDATTAPPNTNPISFMKYLALVARGGYCRIRRRSVIDTTRREANAPLLFIPPS